MMPANQKTVLIIGGGIAGMSAAVRALERGWKAILLECTPHLGGRARSLYAKDVQQFIDNGQHVLSASYEETRQLLSVIGSCHKIDFQKRLNINFRLSRTRSFLLRGWKLPAPLHFLGPLLAHAPLTRQDRRFIFRWAKVFKKYPPLKLEEITVHEWLKEAGESNVLDSLIWEPLALATLNTPLCQASAFLFYQVLQKAFLGASRGSGLGLPGAMLSDIFADPARDYIRLRGGEIFTNSPAVHLLLENGKFKGIRTQKGKLLEAPYCILAIPPHSLQALIAASPGLEQLLANYDQFTYSPIITINLWFKNPLHSHFPLVLVDSRIQWIFKLPEDRAAPNHYGYTAVISAAFQEIYLSKQNILELLERELRRFFGKGIWGDLELAATKIIKEKRATILQTPQAQKLRPGYRTKISNLYLAGDWTERSLPATIESAVLSGKLAAGALPDSI